jgi:hypothetical protein
MIMGEMSHHCYMTLISGKEITWLHSFALCHLFEFSRFVMHIATCTFNSCEYLTAFTFIFDTKTVWASALVQIPTVLL